MLHKSQILLRLCLIYITGIFIFSLLGWLKIEGSPYINQTVNFIGSVVQEPDRRENYQLLVVSFPGQSGLIQLRTNLYPEYFYGDYLEIKGSLEQPLSTINFDYVAYLSAQGINATMNYPEIIITEGAIGQSPLQTGIKNIYQFKQLCQEKIEAIWPMPSSAFISGLILGLKKEMPAELNQYFVRTGTVHILVVSGYHILIISSLLNSIFGYIFIPRPKKIYGIALVLFLFIIFTGGTPSVIRSVIMALGLLLAEKVGRPKSMLNVLIFTITLMLIINPQTLVYDLGFQLSFLATIGLVYLAKPLEKILFFLPNLLTIRSTLASTLGAIILTNPLIIYHFNNLSVIAPLANLFIVPLTSVIMLAGLVIIGLGFISMDLARLGGWGVDLLVQVTIIIAKYFSGLPYAQLPIPELSWVWLAGVYVIIYIIIIKVNKNISPAP